MASWEPQIIQRDSEWRPGSRDVVDCSSRSRYETTTRDSTQIDTHTLSFYPTLPTLLHKMSAATMTSASMTCRVAAKASTQAKSAAATLRAARPAAAFRKYVPPEPSVIA